MTFNLKYRIKGCQDVHVLESATIREIIDFLALPFIEMTTEWVIP